MPLCVAIGCCNKSYRKARNQIDLEENVKITFHRFPKDEAKKLTWIEAMGLQVKSLPKSPHLCSLHFSKNDFDHSSLTRTRLRENAVPILQLETTEIQTSTCHKEEEDNYDDNDEDNEIILRRKRHCSTFDHVYNDQRLEDTTKRKFLHRVSSNQKEYYQQQIRILKQRNKHQEKRITELSTILKELKQKSLLPDRYVDLLKADR